MNENIECSTRRGRPGEAELDPRLGGDAGRVL